MKSRVHVHRSKENLGRAAAAQAAEAIRKAIALRGCANIIVATGSSQFDTIAALVRAPGIDWSRVTLFHLDEYVGLSERHPASFRRYIRERFEARLPRPLKAAHYISGEGDPRATCRQLGEVIRRHPVDVALVGVGENGHLAFNDPPADFDTTEPYLMVTLDEACRRQQMGEGWFASLDDVPRQAISMSVHWIMKSALIVNSVPDQRKAEAVRKSLEGPVTPLCPASILQRHPNCATHLDRPAASLLRDPAHLRGPLRVNGMMIDCSRLMERHTYYFALVDFMVRWDMNTLLFHFNDDDGLGIALPGFEALAMPNAFSVEEMRDFIRYAQSKGIEVIPELETFGHIRYLTNHPAYAHLFVGSSKALWAFNAVDPTHPETLAVMQRLIQATAELFPSGYLHIGCDEVDMDAFCRDRGLDKAATWSGYVNQIIGLVRAAGCTPLMWADHPTKDPAIAEQLRKDVILVDWRYEPQIDEAIGGRLASLGFQDLIAAPAASCYQTRFQPTQFGFENIRKMAGVAFRHGYAGMLTTCWCPYRYYQEALGMALAFGAEAARAPEGLDGDAFRRRFAERELGVPPDSDLLDFLAQAPWVEFERRLAIYLLEPEQVDASLGTPDEIIALARRSVAVGTPLLPKLARWSGHSRMHALILAVKAGWVACEALLIAHEKANDPARLQRYRDLLKEVRLESRAYWRQGRFPEEAEPGFQSPERTNARLMTILRALPEFEVST